jgi:hypothetical protein
LAVRLVVLISPHGWLKGIDDLVQRKNVTLDREDVPSSQMLPRCNTSAWEIQT